MTKKKVDGKRLRYSAEFKQQAVLRATSEGVVAAARDLGLHPTQIYAWRAKSQQRNQDGEAQRLMQSEHARLRREVERLEEENAFLKRAAAYFAKSPK